MKRFLMVVMLGTVVLFSCSGTASATSDQKDEQHGKEPKPGNPEKRRPPQVQQQAPQVQQRPPQVQQRGPQFAAGTAPRPQVYHVPQRSQQQARGWQDHRGWLLRGGWQGRGSWLTNRARNWQVEHRTWEQRGGYGGFYIPENRFILSFGPVHWFRIRTRPVIVAGYPRFWYGGFWFMLVDPWPESWAEDWYTTDDVCIDYNDGYYLYDRRHPGIALAVVVVAP